ncbi:class A sortase [Fructilactobacillus carniphilus]|uniref:Class A sortase n=1 Tax=Fructilactobacillus carniphilus TaxID=2940297 RepID=A0ABY5BU58_9LACO|nr:class A sortase [Fructilactobacillus carniphilus]USS90034.1 class A sortase [Fructilactobacillus carniphilus]
MTQPPKKRRWLKWAERILLLLLLVVGIALVFSSQLEGYWIQWQSHQKVTNISQQEVKRGETKNANYNYQNVQAVSENAVLESEKARKTDAIGSIQIPDLDINLPIFKGLNSENLTIGAGTMKPGQKLGEGNYALAGHHMQNPKILFSPLAKAKKGQIVTIKAGKQTARYRITKIKVVPETDVSVINDVPGKKLLTLVTCASGNPGETRRLIVTGELIK